MHEDGAVGPSRRMGGAKRYPSTSVRLMMGFASLYPSYDLLSGYCRLHSGAWQGAFTSRFRHQRAVSWAFVATVPPSSQCGKRRSCGAARALRGCITIVIDTAGFLTRL